MFDALKNLGGLGGLMDSVRQMQEQMKKLQEELASRQITSGLLGYGRRSWRTA